jgi:hypothetical protein
MVNEIFEAFQFHSLEKKAAATKWNLEFPISIRFEISETIETINPAIDVIKHDM